MNETSSITPKEFFDSFSEYTGEVTLYKAHPLKGFRKKENETIMECHVRPDWLLIWIQNDKVLTLMLTATGTHSDLFGM